MKITQDVLISIYDAALSDRNWARALDASSGVMNADASIVYQVPTSNVVDYRMDSTSSSFRSVPNFFIKYNKLVESGGGSGFDLEGMTYVHSRAPFQVHMDSDIFEMGDQYFQRPEVRFVSDQFGLTRRCAISLSDDPAYLSGVLFLYKRDFSDKESTALQRLQQRITPHISRTLEIHRFTHGLRQKYNAVLSVLDRISTGVLIVSDGGDIIIENAAASQLLGDRDGLVKFKGRFKAQDEAANAALQNSISEVAATAKGENDKSGTVVQIPRRGSGVPLIAVVSPLRDAEMEIDRGLVGALVTIIDPLRPVSVQSDLIATAYKLTKAENRVANLVLQGLSNAQISDRVGVSPETIKTQISSILAKCGCKSRVAFIWRVSQLAPPIE